MSTDTVNPNNCPAVGTFFVQETNSDLGIIKSLSDNGHEIGVTSIDGTLPETEEQWRNNIARELVLPFCSRARVCLCGTIPVSVCLPSLPVCPSLPTLFLSISLYTRA